MNLFLRSKIIIATCLLILGSAVPIAYASETSGTIVSSGNAGYAWSPQAGWVNFGATNSNIQITDSGITGYAWNQNYGWINMNPTNGGVSVAASGALSGYAWNTNLGWINFSSVSINSSGKFTGQASGTIIGTLTFDCTNCNVTTDYRPSSFRTTAPPSSGGGGGGSSSGGGGGGGGGIIQQPIPAPTGTPSGPTGTSVEPPAGVFPPGITRGPSDSGAGESSEETLPTQLFDIRLLLDRPSIARIVDLVARVTFESFGRVPTPVDMTFSIIDADGQELWKSVDTTTVQTEAVFVKRFADAPELSEGSYTLRLSTLYNTDVKDVFEAPFTISSRESPSSYWLLWLIGALLLGILTVFFFLWRRRRKEEETNVSRY